MAVGPLIPLLLLWPILERLLQKRIFSPSGIAGKGGRGSGGLSTSDTFFVVVKSGINKRQPEGEMSGGNNVSRALTL